MDKIDEYVKDLEDCVKSMYDYMCNEMSWEYFRGEMLYPNDPQKQRASIRNAKLIKAYIQEQKEKHSNLLKLLS